ncbi:MAG: aldehyde dehydrogenase family protein [Gammaproteobacteria bacterium]|jgi:acyl-CoA reductase-like NAD-dependent aldehyde dehydrogenase|nr:aldehyde dehydrogenase family protein [Gammaproteobacteria bacterium]MDP7297454.1 aldehyde dehydrogenase family protein [Gammaproteobacteria bacterium]MDP7418620.1 aldehyde dehydrogenase family protein [Gammaproteobacteria bacterium]|tara:strand:- start:309 stop:674 length:366 start_codon:yes stop_codon:yes gene_type:complete
MFTIENYVELETPPSYMVIGDERIDTSRRESLSATDPASGQVFTVANSTQFGPVAGIYTKDATKAPHFARGGGAWQIFINQIFAGGVATPFSGIKNSGFGREKGSSALSSYFQAKCATAPI